MWVSRNGQTLFVTEKLKCYLQIQCLLSRGEEMGLRHIYRVACSQLFSCPSKDIGPLFFVFFYSLLYLGFRNVCSFVSFLIRSFLFGIFTPSLSRNVCLCVSSVFYSKRILHIFFLYMIEILI